MPEAIKIAVTGGGTAGHTLPGIAFLQAFRREWGAEGYFIGCAGGFETRLVSAGGERLELIPGGPWARQNAMGQLRAALNIPRGVLAARALLRREKTELLIGAGGYASFGACLAARSLQIPVVIYESNAELGMANRILEKFAALVCVAFGETGFGITKPVEITGVPLASLHPSTWRAAAPWRFLVLGGSEGSPPLNEEAPRLFAALKERGIGFSVRHIAGFGDLAAISAQYAAAGIDASVEGFTNDMASVYDGVTFAITSAGIHTLAELSAAGIPSLIVPLSGAARNHQFANASLYAARTGAKVIPETEWHAGNAAAWLAEMLNNPEALHTLHRDAASWVNRNAALAMVKACERLIQ
ncbi:MAG TPA: glycosyltransferase [Bryobacteraceae bacterium]|jgi:UDP-N-acetylglucosamine--N-acetylmuramyl-(pentapeptide) pyrophosphoryl-undecaprenol N-acetylglucosamine transferase